MEIKICKTCGKQFLSEANYSYCRICSKKWHEEQAKIKEQAENLKWQEQRKQERELFKSEVQAYKPILMKNVTPSAHTLYIIGNGFDLMHRVPSSYYNFRDGLGKSINRRLSHIFLDEDDITFVYNNRVRKYDLNTGKMIVNQQLRDARSKEYSGNNIISKFVKKRTYY